MDRKEFHRMEVAVLLAEREANMEQGLPAGASAPLQVIWGRLPALAAELREIQELVDAVEADPELLNQLIYAAQLAEQREMERAS